MAAGKEMPTVYYAQLARGIFSKPAYIANMFWRHRELTGKLSVAERSLGQRFCAMPFRNITSVYNNGEYGIVPCSCPG